MIRTTDENSPPKCGSTIQIFLHLGALNAFALAQPIFDQLAENAAFLRYYNYSGASVIVSVGMFLFAVPCVSTLLIVLLNRFQRPRGARRVLGATVWLLTSLSALIVARWFSTTMKLLNLGIADYLVSLIAIAIASGLSMLYFRSSALRQALLLCSTGMVLFPLRFFCSDTFQTEVMGVSSLEVSEKTRISNPVPVVMIVFDGLCGMALLNEDYQIDKARYPGFGRLAEVSNFYRNASTVHPRTDHAVPAILSGSFPVEEQNPIEEHYPLNLFRLLHESQQYEMTIFEPFTQMAPGHLHRVARQGTTLQESLGLLNILLRVYARLCLPKSIELLETTVPREWFRMIPPESADPRAHQGKIVYSWDSDRRVQLEHFLSCLNPSEKPGFRFLHIAIPHDPWSLLPSGRQCTQYSQYGEKIVGCASERWTTDQWLVNQGWQRYLLQLQYADRFVGQLLDRLEDSGQLDAAMIVLTADHGMAFVPGQERRNPGSATMPDILSVPLFIKRPGQRTPLVSDRNVETVDILPSIAEVLGVSPDPGWDGVSFLNTAPEKPRKSISGNFDSVVEAAFPQRFQYTDRMLKTFGSGTDDRLQRLNLIPDMVDSPLSIYKRGSPSLFTCSIEEGAASFDPKHPEFVPCYIRARLLRDANSPVQLAVAINGYIRATTRTSEDATYGNQWTALLPESAFTSPSDELAVFEIEASASGPILHEIPLEQDI